MLRKCHPSNRPKIKSFRSSTKSNHTTGLSASHKTEKYSSSIFFRRLVWDFNLSRETAKSKTWSLCWQFVSLRCYRLLPQLTHPRWFSTQKARMQREPTFALGITWRFCRFRLSTSLDSAESCIARQILRSPLANVLLTHLGSVTGLALITPKLILSAAGFDCVHEI